MSKRTAHRQLLEVHKQQLCTAGGSFCARGWDASSTLLVAGGAQTTPKLAQALLAGIPLVTPGYISLLLKNARASPLLPLPLPSAFDPRSIKSETFSSSIASPSVKDMWEGADLSPQRGRVEWLRGFVYAAATPPEAKGASVSCLFESLAVTLFYFHYALACSCWTS